MVNICREFNCSHLSLLNLKCKFTCTWKSVRWTYTANPPPQSPADLKHGDHPLRAPLQPPHGSGAWKSPQLSLYFLADRIQATQVLIGRRRPIRMLLNLPPTGYILEIKLRGFASPRHVRPPQQDPEREIATLQDSGTGFLCMFTVQIFL